jgi:predicted transposase/invertase (TIGR01784 family)
LGEEKIYSGKKILLPRPEFIVLYNGVAPLPDTQTIRLSDSFEEALSFGLPRELAPLELVAKVYNINAGHNLEITRRSGTLEGYGVFVAKIREFEAEILGGEKRALEKDELRAAMMKAIRWCIAHDKIRGFLETNSSEVLNMLLAEWNWDKFMAVREREAVERGWQEGRQEGWQEGRQEGWQKGREERDIEIARGALAKGFPLETVSEITGIDTTTIRELAGR